MTDLRTSGEARQVTESRWGSYVLLRDHELEELWRARFEACKRALVILGHGFDPRMCSGISGLKSSGLLEKCDVWLLDYSGGGQPTDASVAAMIHRNGTRLAELIAGVQRHTRVEIQLRSNEGRQVGARNAAAVMAECHLVDYSDIIVDISALPRTLYFPLIGTLLHRIDAAADAGLAAPNLYAVVSESSRIDSRIVEESVEPRADYLPGFTGGLDQEAFGSLPTVWIPLLGERQATQLLRIYDLVLPDEICPVFPSPSAQPRRADDLVLEYRELLFDRLRIEPKNVLYAAEQNPFEVYRQLRRTVFRYEGALASLGGCKTAISVLSSKLMSVGALLTVYELKALGHHVGIAHVEANTYSPDGDLASTENLGDVHLFGLWLAGDCYAR